MNTAQVSALERFMKSLGDQDKTLVDWADEKKLPIGVVYMVTNRRVSGHRGIGRKVFRAMGLPLPKVKARKVTA